MNAGAIQTGSPKLDGRYVAFIQCDAAQAREWVEPVIMTYSNGKWHTTFLKNKIVGWLGPIPPMKVADIEATEVYDL